WARGTGAGAILLNPLHAIAFSTAAGDPVPPSPYSPSSRRFINPIYLRVEDTSTYRDADPSERAAAAAPKPSNTENVIDYDAVWQAKHAELKLLWTGHNERSTDAAVTRFATFNALVEKFGADWHRWPDGVKDSAADPREVAFHVWLQELCA